MGNAERDELDRLLDAGLASYSNSEPRPGLEARVLSRVHAAEARRRPWFGWLALAAPVAAYLVILVANRPASIPEQPAVAVVEAPAEPAPVVEAPIKPPVRRPRKAVPARPPKQEQFPAAAPLTKEERALIELAVRMPEALRSEPPAEIEIEPIQIEPLQTGGSSEEIE